MSKDLNIVEAPPEKVNDDLIAKASRFGAFGWIAFFITLFVLVTQNTIYMLMPKQVLASENGKIIGQVLFDEAKVRPVEAITADLKNWVLRCTSVNKITIYEDIAICLNHMEPELAELKMVLYEESLYLQKITQFGCERTSITFDDSITSITRDTFGYSAVGRVAGEVTCFPTNDKPNSQSFDIQADMSLIKRTTNTPLALKVTDFRDVEK